MKTYETSQKGWQPFCKQTSKILKKAAHQKANAGHFGALVQESLYRLICEMDSREALTNEERSKIIQGLTKKQSTLEIAKIIGRDHRTVKKFVNQPDSCNGRADKGKPRKKPTCVASGSPSNKERSKTQPTPNQ